MLFDWDDRKAARNARKHGVTFDEAMTSFFDEAVLDLGESDHSDDETRYNVLGRSARGRLLMVSYTYRGSHADETIWIISARDASPRERRRFHEEA